MILFWSMLIGSFAVLVLAALVIQHRARQSEPHPARSPFRSRMRHTLSASESPEAEMLEDKRLDRVTLPHRRFRPPHLVSWSLSRVEPDRQGPDDDPG